MNFAVNLKNARKRLRLNQTELAKIIGTGQEAISKYETGKSTPKIDKIPKLAQVLGVSIDDLLDNWGQP